MNAKFVLTQEESQDLARRYGTPLMVVSRKKLEERYKCLQHYLPRVKIFYAMKANPSEVIVQHLAKLGSCFDVASAGEINQLASYGIKGDRMLYANPVKSRKALRTARDYQVSRMTYDSEAEIDKIKDEYPGATVLLRVQVSNPSAMVDLNTKFGAAPEKAVELLKKAKQSGLDVAGVSFHVGSQSISPEGYRNAIALCAGIFADAAEEGVLLKVLDIGGGFPIPQKGAFPDLPGMLQAVNNSLEEHFPDTEIWAEPGRFLCGESANIIASIIGVSERSGKPFYTLDEGTYGSFSAKFFDHWDFEPITFREGEKTDAILAGPSCDSLDILFSSYPLPAMQMDDLLLFTECGAYTYASSSTFNGFERIKVIMLED